MSVGGQGWRRSMKVRIAGLASVAIVPLLHTVERVGHAASPEKFLPVLFGFLGLSAGAGLVCLGARTQDRIEASERWANIPSRRFI